LDSNEGLRQCRRSQRLGSILELCALAAMPAIAMIDLDKGALISLLLVAGIATVYGSMHDAMAWLREIELTIKEERGNEDTTVQ
jgi:hypothetical protein